MTVLNQYKTFYGPAPAAVMGMLKKPEALNMIHADFCPFANRVWVALLEKEKNPLSPVLFEETMCSYMLGEKDPGTKILYGTGLKTVPAVIYNGQILTESATLANFIDDLFPANPLKPTYPVMRFNMHCFMESNGPLIGSFYKFLRNQDSSENDILSKKLGDLLIVFNKDLAMFPGPFLCGELFTLADIHFFGFIERIMITLPHYKNWSFPLELKNILVWYDALKSRPSFKVVTGERSVLSLETHPYEAKGHAEYIIEMYECYANDEIALAKEKLAEAGSPGINAYRRFKLAQK